MRGLKNITQFLHILIKERAFAFTIIKFGTHEGNSLCDRSRGQVPLCELAIFASKSGRRDQLRSMRLVPRIQTSLNFWKKSLRLVARNASCKLFVGQVLTTSSLLLQGLVPSCAQVRTFSCRQLRNVVLFCKLFCFEYVLITLLSVFI